MDTAVEQGLPVSLARDLAHLVNRAGMRRPERAHRLVVFVRRLAGHTPTRLARDYTAVGGPPQVLGDLANLRAPTLTGHEVATVAVRRRLRSPPLGCSRSRASVMPALRRVPPAPGPWGGQIDRTGASGHGAVHDRAVRDRRCVDRRGNARRAPVTTNRTPAWAGLGTVWYLTAIASRAAAYHSSTATIDSPRSTRVRPRPLGTGPPTSASGRPPTTCGPPPPPVARPTSQSAIL